MERIQPSNACHFFMACRHERPKIAMLLTFRRIPRSTTFRCLRLRCGLSDNEMFRSDWRFQLNAAQLPFVQHVDGRRTIREIAERVARRGEPRRANAADLEKFGRNLFQALWRLDFFSMAIKTG
jgi:hypothetical protein